MREDVAANAAILRRLAEIDKTLLVHDVTLREILQKLRPLLEPAPQPPKPEIGFHVKEHAVRYQVRKRQRAWIERLPEPRTTSFRTWPGSLANSDSGNWSRQSRTGQRLLELSAGNENSVDNTGMIIA